MTAENPTPETPKPSRSGKVTKWIFGIVAVAAATFLTAKLTGVYNDVWDWLFPEDPITVSVTHRSQCPWVFTALAPDVQRALDSDHGSEIDMRRAGAIDGDQSAVEITVQAKPGKTVVLNDMRAAMVEKRPPPTDGFVVGGCGGLQTVRMFIADLDRPPSTAVPQAGQNSNGEPTPDFHNVKPTIKSGDVELFNFVVSTKACDCTWRIELDWASDGRSGTTVVAVDDHGAPFRTIAAHTGVLRGAYIDSETRQLVLLGRDGLPLK